MVTVGTAVASRPPYRSRRALLTHRAPPSGSGVEAVTRQRVYRSDWRKGAGDALDEPLPAEACRLAAPLERCEPEPLHLVEEPPQARVVARDSEVVQMPFQHLFHPSPGFRDGVVHYPAQLDHGRTTAPESLQPRAVWFHCARIAAVAASWSAEDWHFMARPFEQLCGDRDATGACFGAESDSDRIIQVWSCRRGQWLAIWPTRSAGA